MDQAERARGLAGGAILAALFTGSVSLIIVFLGFLTWNIQACAIALVAAAIAFTGIANAILRR